MGCHFWVLRPYPFIVPPDISIVHAAAPLNVLRSVLRGVAVGSVILIPTFLYLFRLFKGGERKEHR